MNSMVIDSVRGVNRIEAFADSQRAAGLHEVNPAELQAVEGGVIGIDDLIIFGCGVIVGLCIASVLR
jgi:hypothetical protein